jgi:hypothetical protein
VLRHCRAVARNGDARTLRHAVLTSVRMLRTETVAARRGAGDNHGRGVSCKLCGAPEETVEHTMEWCAHGPVAAARRRLVRAGALACGDHGATPLRAAMLARGREADAFFDPSGRAKLVLGPGAKMGWQGYDHGGLLGVLGVLPAGAAETLRWEWAGGRWRRCPRREAQARAGIGGPRRRCAEIGGGGRLGSTRQRRDLRAVTRRSRRVSGGCRRAPTRGSLAGGGFTTPYGRGRMRVRMRSLRRKRGTVRRRRGHACRGTKWDGVGLILGRFWAGP